jgi:hypothetical protein
MGTRLGFIIGGARLSKTRLPQTQTRKKNAHNRYRSTPARDMNSQQNNHHLISAVFSSVTTTSAKQAKSKTSAQPKQKIVAATKPPQQNDNQAPGIKASNNDKNAATAPGVKASNNDENAATDGWITVATKNFKKVTVPDKVNAAKSGKNSSKKVALVKQASKKKEIVTPSVLGNSKSQIGLTSKSASTENKPAPSFLSIMGFSSDPSKSSKRSSRRRRNHKEKSQEQPVKEHDVAAGGDFNNTMHTATTASCATEIPSQLGSEPDDDNETLMPNVEAAEDKPLIPPSSALLDLPYDILTGGVLSTATGTKILADEPEFAKPDRDMHEYRYIQLANNLKVLLVSTAKASSGSADEKSSKVEAASVHVQAGHFDDTIPGLAHFHEHMLVRIVKSRSVCFFLYFLFLCLCCVYLSRYFGYAFFASHIGTFAFVASSFLEQRSIPTRMITNPFFRNLVALAMPIPPWKIPTTTLV